MQEDREIDLDRIFSFHGPGQYLATTVGLFVWNLRTCWGRELGDPLPTELPPQPARLCCSTTHTLHSCAVQSAADARSALMPSELDTLPTKRSHTVSKTLDNPPETAQSSLPPRNDTPTSQTVVSSFVRGVGPTLALLVTLNWPKRLQTLPGWTWRDDPPALYCPAGCALRLHSIDPPRSNGSLTVRLRARRSQCQRCPQRSSCTQSLSPYFQREITFTVTEGQACPRRQGCPPAA